MGVINTNRFTSDFVFQSREVLYFKVRLLQERLPLKDFWVKVVKGNFKPDDSLNTFLDIC